VRDEKRGAEAVKNLTTQGLSNILFHQLEVGDISSTVHLADFIREIWQTGYIGIASVSFPTS
jgi:(+)-neomenthol dehydrogenase